jgi:hypothetical protein
VYAATVVASFLLGVAHAVAVVLADCAVHRRWKQTAAYIHWRSGGGVGGRVFMQMGQR